MTDNEIIKLLECCKKSQCSKCYYSKECDGYTQVNYALDLITRQQAELENLKVKNQSLRGAANSLKMHYEEAQAEIERLKSCVKSEDEVREIAKRTMESLVKEITREQIDIAVKLAKAEAYKEFADRLKERIYKGGVQPTVEDEFMCDIDNLLKEIGGEEE